MALVGRTKGQFSSSPATEGEALQHLLSSKLAELDGRQVVMAVIPGPLVLYLEDAEVDPEIETGADGVRQIPSGDLLQRLHSAGGSLG